MQEYNWRKERKKYQTDLTNQPEQAPASSGQSPSAQEPAAAPAAAKKSHAPLWIAVASVCIAAAAAAVIVPPLLKQQQSEAPKAAAKAAPAENTETTVSSNTEAAPEQKPETASADEEAVSAKMKAALEVPVQENELPKIGLDTATMLADVADRYKSAVGLVVLILRNKKGRGLSIPIGTAWAFAPDRFATNAHVANALNMNYQKVRKEILDSYLLDEAEKAGKEDADSYLKSLSRSKRKKVMEEAEKAVDSALIGFDAVIAINGQNHKNFSISHVQIHPEYDGPFSPDVAVLTIEGNSDVYFKIADSETLGKLRSGDPIAYLGFPSENLNMHNVNIDNPVASMQTGIIVAVSDFELKDGGPSGNFFVRHNLPLTGGASGSPAFNRNGEVVALVNAMNIIDSIYKDFGRTPSAAMINFGVRSDLLEGVGEPVDIKTFVKQK